MIFTKHNVSLSDKIKKMRLLKVILVYLSLSFTLFAQAQSFNLQLPSDTTLCLPDTLSLNVGQNFECTYTWIINDTIRSKDSIFDVTPSLFGKIFLQITQTADTNLKLIDSIQVDYYPIIPLGILGNDTSVCKGDSLLLDASFPNGIYYWLDPDYDTILAKLPSRMLYADSLKSSAIPYVYTLWLHSGCRDTAYYKSTKERIEIFYVNPPKFKLIEDSLLKCRDEEFPLEALEPNFENFLSPPLFRYLWSTSDTTATITAVDSGWHWLQVNNVCGDTTTDSIYIEQIPYEWTNFVNFITDTSICDELTLTLNATIPYPNTRYEWDDDTNQRSGLRTFTKSGTYTLTLTDEKGCTNSDVLNLKLDNCQPKIEAPNVFTPNGDGVNDEFRLKTADKIVDFEIFIYDRWGSLVFKYKGEPLQARWNGRKNNTGASLANGAYFFVATYKDVYGKKGKTTGSITLLR